MADAALLELDVPGFDHGWANWKDCLQHWTDAEPEEFTKSRLDSYLIVMDSAKRGEGIALGQLGLIDDMLERGEMVVIGKRVNRSPMGYYLVRRPQHHRAERAVEAILQNT